VDALLDLLGLQPVHCVLHFAALKLDGEKVLHVHGAIGARGRFAVNSVLKINLIAEVGGAEDRDNEDEQRFPDESQQAPRGDHGSMSVSLRNRSIFAERSAKN
jgi:hypothetical protein